MVKGWVPRAQWLAERKSLAVTAVDTWLRFKHGDEGTTEDFRRELLVRTASPHMLAGSAAHAVLEHAEAGEVVQGSGTSFRDLLDLHPDDLRELGTALSTDRTYPTPYGSHRIESFGDDYYTVTMDERGVVSQVDLRWEISDDVELTLPPVREMTLGGAYPTRIGEVWVSGRVDGFDRIEVVDHKFQGSPDAESIAETYQWRIYLDLAKADRFRWNLFTMKEPLKGESAWRITAMQQLVNYAYPAMHEDVVRAVDDAAAAIDRYAPEYWKRYDTAK